MPTPPSHTLTSSEQETILGHLSQLHGDAFERKLAEIAANFQPQGATPELLRDMVEEYRQPKLFGVVR